MNYITPPAANSTVTPMAHHHQPTTYTSTTTKYATSSPTYVTPSAPSVHTNSTTDHEMKGRRAKNNLVNNTIPYEISHKAVRQISMHSEEDWDAVADHAAIEWGQRRGPRRGRDADDLTVTVRDIAPSLGKFFDKLGCCGEKKTRVLHRPQESCHPIQQIHTETGGMMSHTGGAYFPQGVLLESGAVGMGVHGVGHNHGVDQYGGYQYHGQRESSAIPNKFDSYDTWKHPTVHHTMAVNKTPLPQFEQSFNSRAFNAAPGMVNTHDLHRIFHKSDVIQLDGAGRVVIPEFQETTDGKLTGAVRV